MSLLFLLRRRPRTAGTQRCLRYRGTVAGFRSNERRDFASGIVNFERDYFGIDAETPNFDDRDFETRFRVPSSVFRRVYQAASCEPFLQQRINATGCLQTHTLEDIVAAFRVMAYGEAADLKDEYMRLSCSNLAQATNLLLQLCAAARINLPAPS